METPQNNSPKLLLVKAYYNHIIYRLRKIDKTYFKLICGGVGDGKSTSAYIDAFFVNPKRFGPEYIALNQKEYLDAKQDAKKGTIVVWEESGVGLERRQWFKLSNILTTQAFQVEREKNCGTIFCTPDPTFLESRVISLTDCYSEMEERWNMDFARSYLYKMKKDRKKGQVYYPWYSFHINGLIYNIPTIVYTRKMVEYIKRKKPKEWNEIVKKISEFKQKVLEKAKKMADNIEEEREKNFYLPTNMDYVNSILRDIWENGNQSKFYNADNKIDWHLVSHYCKISRDKAQTILRLVNKSLHSKRKDKTHTDSIISNIYKERKNPKFLDKERKDLTKYMKSKGGLKQDK